ncbi:MAG: hypothetical protein PUK54_08220 [Firmicutes bacterium]|nr:hypothetical protein [Bacillota bacterium]MDD7602561.1 hypothetical protein [Bacillota bacterium]MDY5856824.1 hypothetical protein [Anaerovoracaceae bacterium]
MNEWTAARQANNEKNIYFSASWIIPAGIFMLLRGIRSKFSVQNNFSFPLPFASFRGAAICSKQHGILHHFA